MAQDEGKRQVAIIGGEHLSALPRDRQSIN